MTLDTAHLRSPEPEWTRAELELVRNCAAKYLRLGYQGGNDCGPSALRDETSRARTRLLYALKREPLPKQRAHCLIPAVSPGGPISEPVLQ